MNELFIMSCFYHRNVSEVSSCERCNRPVCLDCLLTFINKKTYKSRPDPDEEEMDYHEATLKEDNKEELHWCLPCYYAHFSNELAPQIGFTAISVWIILDLLAFGVVSFVLLFFLNYQYNFSLLKDIFSSPLYETLVSGLFIVGFYVLYQRRKQDLDEKVKKVEAVKERFLEITTIGTITEPITCYYCKYDIQPDEFVCMNLDCTLGETIDRNAKPVQIKAVNEHFGFFDTLNKLPKIPEEKKKDN